MWRVSLFILAFWTGFLLNGCAKRLPTDPTRFERVDRSDYSYQRIDDGAVLIAAKDPAALRRALKEIGCDKEYVCLVDVNGHLYEVRQKKK